MLKGISQTFQELFLQFSSQIFMCWQFKGQQKATYFFLSFAKLFLVCLRSLGGQCCRAGGSLLKSNSKGGAHSHLFPSLAQFPRPSCQRINNFLWLAMSLLPFLKCLIPGFHRFRSCFTGHSLLLCAGSLSEQPRVRHLLGAFLVLHSGSVTLEVLLL